MPDIILERLELIKQHALTILSRMQHIKSAEELIATTNGELIFDATIIRLQAIGENFKKLKSYHLAFAKVNYT